MPYRLRGFTLIEILVALAIIGVLTAIAVPAYNGYMQSSRENTARHNAQMLALFQEQYFSENQEYCDGSYQPGGTFTGCLNTLAWNPVDGVSYKDKFSYNVAACDGGTLAQCYKITVKEPAHSADPLAIVEGRAPNF